MSEKEMTVGDRIRQTRKQAGMSQIELAAEMGVIKQTLYKYESGIVTNIPYEKVEVAAKALGVTPGYLMGWETMDEQGLVEAKHRSIDHLLDKLSPSELQMVEGIIRQIIKYRDHS